LRRCSSAELLAHAAHRDEFDDRTCCLERKKPGIIETAVEKASVANGRMYWRDHDAHQYTGD
jgi:hypothetical protein